MAEDSIEIGESRQQYFALVCTSLCRLPRLLQDLSKSDARLAVMLSYAKRATDYGL